MTLPRHPDPDDLLLYGKGIPYTRAKLHPDSAKDSAAVDIEPPGQQRKAG